MAKGMYVGVKGSVARKVKRMYVGAPVSASVAESIRLKNPQNVYQKEIAVGLYSESYYWSVLSNEQLVKTDRQSFLGGVFSNNITMLNGKYALFNTDLDHIYYVKFTADAPSQQAGTPTITTETTIAITGTMYDIEADVARKVKKAYVGIGGVARPFFGTGAPVYYGRATDMTVDRTCMSGVTMGTYALFAGGLRSVSSSGDTAANNIDIYDNKLIHTTTTLSAARYRMAGVGMEDWSLFAGGKTGADSSRSCSANVYKIDTNFVKNVASTGLTTAVWAVSGSSVGAYALVAGGRTTTSSGVVSNVAAYSKSLTKTVVTSLSTANAFMAGCRLNDNLVLFGGGNKSSYVNAYNSSLTRSLSTVTFYNNQNMGTVVLDGKAVYAGGYDSNSTGRTAVYLFDSSLTRIDVSTGLIKGRPPAGVAMEDYALFGGGYYGTTAGAWQCDIYDKSMTRTNPTEDMGKVNDPISYTPSGTKVGDYALFAGDYGVWARAFVQ